MGVEPSNQEGPGCQDLGRVLVLIKNTWFVRDNGTNQRSTVIKNPSLRIFWCGISFQQKLYSQRKEAGGGGVPYGY